MDDIFDLFSDDFFPSETKQTKKEKKAGKGDAREIVYDLPLKVACDGRAINLTDVLVGKQQLTMKELQAAVYKIYPWYPEDISSIDVDESERMAFVSYKNHGTQKGELQMKENDILRVMGKELDVSNLVSQESTTIEINMIQDAIKKEFPECYSDKSPLWNQISILRSDKAGLLVAIMPPDPVQAIPIGEVLIFVPPGEIAVEVSLELQQRAIQKREAEGVNELTVPEVEEILLEEGIILKRQLTISKTNVSHMYYLLTNTSVKRNVATKPKELYPTIDTTLSVYYAKYPLSPSDFSGEEKVDKNALLAFLVERGHKEYSYCDVRINYSDKGKMILVSAVGSTKGYEPVASIREFPELKMLKELLDKQEDVFYQDLIDRDGSLYHIIENPIFTAVLMDKATPHKLYLDWKLPKISGKVFSQGAYICQYVYSLCTGEVCMDLYYSQKDNEYVWSVPNQVVTTISAQTVTDPFLEITQLSGLIKVGQVHSHGHHPAFFSMIDNKDEVIPGLYGVWGSIQTSEPEFKLRLLVSYGQFIPLQPDLFFELNKQPLSTIDKKLLRNKVNRHLFNSISELDEPMFYLVELEDKNLLLINTSDADVYRKCKGIFTYDVYEDIENMEYRLSEQPQENAVISLLSKDVLDLNHFSGLNVAGKVEPTKRMMSILDYME